MLCNPPLERGTMREVFRLLIDEFSFARTLSRLRQKIDDHWRDFSFRITGGLATSSFTKSVYEPPKVRLYTYSESMSQSLQGAA
jgi:hypothetical protein